ncbi:MAG TPA: zf-HC2 domain-containing protein [Rhizomicrobium sp.]|nr:zf-HC2 domain-containing protein [Rhizomicrobium sp.]
MSCPELLRTQAFLDGELDGAAAAQAERHIESCAECQRFCSDAANLSDAIREQASRYDAPNPVRARILGALKPEGAKSAPRRSFWSGVAGGVGVSALAAAISFFAVLPPSAEMLAQSVTDAHTRAMMNGKTIQIASSSHHTVKPWFAGRIAISPPVADFQDEGFTLTGGRIDKIAGLPAAVVVYSHGKHQIDLFVWADQGSNLPGDSTSHGYHVLFWKKADLDFAAVSDTDKTELKKFVGLVKAEPE